MFVRPRNLSILTTRRCPAACDHCSVGAGPRETIAIPVERIHRLIDEATKVPSIERIGFSGGECFVLGRHLDALVGHASRLGFVTRVVTNGYWAVNARRAQERVSTIRAAGLDEMMLSTGTFHERFVPVERVIAAARASVEAGISTRISIESCDQSTFDESVLRSELADLIAAHSIVLAHDPWIPDAGGRGTTQLTHDRHLNEAGPYVVGRCAQVLDVLSVTSDQQLMACCGFPSEQLPALRIGSVAERPLDSALESAPNELLKKWLHVSGPAGIAAFVAYHIPNFKLPPAASICQACVALQRDRSAMDVISRHAAEVAQLVDETFIRLQHGAQSPLRQIFPATST